MSSTFLTLRYVAFALFILFNSVICILAAFNLGSLIPHTQKFPEVDSYLIFMGALGVVFAFSVIFIELFRRNAFISRVAVEIVWVAIFWIMSLSGAAAMTAIAPLLRCSPKGTGVQPEGTCVSTKALVAFTWLSTITLLSYLFGLVISAVIHNQDNSLVWEKGVRDFPWYTQRKPPQNPPDATFTYGKLADPREPSYLPPIYAQQMPFGGNAGYQVEPLKIEQSVQPIKIERSVQPQLGAAKSSQPPAADHMRDFKFPARPTPVALRVDTQAGDAYRSIPPPAETTKKPLYSLYPQFVQASGGNVPQPPKPNGPTPPPAGSWPRSNPQEPLRKSRPSPSAPSAYPRSAEPLSSSEPLSATESRPLPRPRPAGPRHSSIDRQHRPPPLDLSLTSRQ